MVERALDRTMTEKTFFDVDEGDEWSFVPGI